MFNYCCLEDSKEKVKKDKYLEYFKKRKIIFSLCATTTNFILGLESKYLLNIIAKELENK